jgi:hypothetical protein
VGSMSDQPKPHSPVCGVSGLLFAALLVALSLVRQSPELAGPENVYANFYKWGVLLAFAAWTAVMTVLTRFRARTIQERSP